MSERVSDAELAAMLASNGGLHEDYGVNRHAVALYDRALRELQVRRAEHSEAPSLRHAAQLVAKVVREPRWSPETLEAFHQADAALSAVLSANEVRRKELQQLLLEHSVATEWRQAAAIRETILDLVCGPESSE